MAERKRRQKGEGSLFQRKSDGMWIGIVQNGYDAEGKPRKKYVSSKSYAKAQAKLTKAKRELAEFGALPTAGVTLEKWLRQWLANVRVKPSTLYSYRSTCDLYLIPTMGKRRLDQLAPQHIRDMEKWMDGKGLSSATVHRAHRVLRAALNDAVREGVATRNVAKNVKPPSLAGKEQDSLTLDQARLFLSTLKDDDPNAARWAVALLLGVRQGEALGIEAHRLDLDAGTLDLSWQLQRIQWEHGCGPEIDKAWACGRKRGGSCPERRLMIPKDFECRVLSGGLCLTRPKSQAGYRVIPLPEFVVIALRGHIARHGISPDGLIFHREDGRPIDPKDDNHAWHDALAERDLPQIKLHAARHTTASLLLAAGVDAKVIQAIMGHSSVLMTRAYQHASIDMARAGMGAMSEMLLLDSPKGELAEPVDELAVLRARIAELEARLPAGGA